jgi:hypothetical protein
MPGKRTEYLLDFAVASARRTSQPTILSEYGHGKREPDKTFDERSKNVFLQNG